MRTRITVVIAALLLAACGDGGGSASGNGGTAASGEGQAGGAELTIGIWNDAQRPALQRVVDAFHEEHPDIRASIEVTPYDLYWQKLEAAATGGVAPDVFWMNAPNAPRFAEAGVIEGLSERVEQDGQVDLANYADPIVEMYTIDGELWALPRDMDVIGLWYNTKLFEAAGVQIPDESWTWDDVRKAAEALTDAEAGVYGIASDFNFHQSYWNTIYQAGGRVLAEDKTESGWHLPATQEGLQYWIDFIDAGWSPTLAQMTDTDPRSMLESGLVAMWYGGSWHALHFAENEKVRDVIDVAPLPAGKQEAVILHGLGYALSSKTPNPEEAWTLAQFLTSSTAAEIEGGEGSVAPAYGDASDLWVKAHDDFNLAPLFDQLDQAVPYPASVTSPEWAEAMEEHLRPVWAGEMEVKEAAEALKPEMDKILAGED